jgi:hypothetical protein
MESVHVLQEQWGKCFLGSSYSGPDMRVTVGRMGMCVKAGFRMAQVDMQEQRASRM